MSDTLEFYAHPPLTRAGASDSNEFRMAQWRRTYWKLGLHPSMNTHFVQQQHGIDWTKRDENGLIKLDAAGYLPRKPLPSAAQMYNELESKK